MDCKHAHGHRLADTEVNLWTEKKNLKKTTMSVVNAGPPDTVSVLSTRCGACHPKGLIVASSYKIKQTIIIITTTRISTSITFIGQFQSFF